MGLFTSKTRRQEQEARTAATEVRREAEAKARAQRRREDAWRSDRNAAIQSLRTAERAHAQAKQSYDRYAPGPQKTAAAQKVNAAADRLASAERAFKAVDHFRAWSRNH